MAVVALQTLFANDTNLYDCALHILSWTFFRWHLYDTYIYIITSYISKLRYVCKFPKCWHLYFMIRRQLDTPRCVPLDQFFSLFVFLPPPQSVRLCSSHDRSPPLLSLYNVPVTKTGWRGREGGTMSREEEITGWKRWKNMIHVNGPALTLAEKNLSLSPKTYRIEKKTRA